MKLFTIATKKEYEIETYHHEYIKKVEYSEADCKRFLEEAKKYYCKYIWESESTDFNDRYSDSSVSYYQINYENMIIKDNEFYGAVVCGLARHNSRYIICTLEKLNARYYDGSDYSYVEQNYQLQKYELPTSAIDFVQEYYIDKVIKYYTERERGDKLKDEYHYEITLTAFDVVMVDGVAVGLKYDGHEYRLDNPESLELTIREADAYVNSRYCVKEMKLIRRRDVNEE